MSQDHEDGRATAGAATCSHASHRAASRLSPAGFDQAQGEIIWLRATLKRCAEITVLEDGDSEEALEALASIRGLIAEVLNNPAPPVAAGASL